MGNWEDMDLAKEIDASVKHHRSLTWKERHAKGVPVKMTQDDWIRFNHHDLPDGHHWYLKTATGDVGVNVYHSDNVASIAVKFCNFRYKPEWLEKLENERKIHWLKTHQAL